MELTLQFPEKVKSLALVSTSASVKVKLSFLPKLIKRVRSRMSKQEQPYYAFMRQIGASHDYDCSNRFSEIDVPTLIMCGQNDRRVSDSQIKEMSVGIKGSKLIMFRGGHMFFLFENKRFTDCLMEFLRSS